MKRRTGLLLVSVALVMASLSCRAAAALLDQPPSPTQTEAPAIEPSPSFTVEASPTSLPSFTPTPTSSPTPVPPSPTAVQVPTWTSAPPLKSPNADDVAVQLRIFQQLWEIVDQEYMYEDFNGVDWDAVYVDYRARVEAGLTRDEFYLAMSEMVDTLGDDHSTFLSPDDVAEAEAELAGENNYVGIGVVTILIPERNRASVIAVFPGSPAEQAGIQVHDSLLAVDGQAVVDETGDHREIMRGPEGTTIQVTVQSPGEEPRQVTITRRVVQGAMPVPYQVIETPDGMRIGYVLLITFFDETIDDQVAAALREMSAAGPLDGIILDNRYNGGGISNVVLDTLRYFVDGLTGHFVSRQEQRPFVVQGLDIAGSQQVPLVVLVGPGTASFGEIFSGILKDFGRAHLIGDVTDGNVEILYGYDFEDGSRAWIAHDYFQPLNNPDEDWELTGIIPHRVIPTAWDQYTLETDPALQAALEYFQQGQ